MELDVTDITLPTNLPPEVNTINFSAEDGVRELRNRLLRENVDSFNPIRYATLTDTQKEQLAKYRQDLLDVTKQPGWPGNVVWPEKPSWI